MHQRSFKGMLACVAPALLLVGGGMASGQARSTPEQVVHAHAEAWSRGDLPGLLALFADDARSYDRSPDPHRLAGGLSDTIGSKRQLEAYYRTVSPPSRERVVETASVGDLVIAAGESAQPPDFEKRMRFLTGFRVRDGRIHDLWHLAWTPVEPTGRPDASEVVRALIAAGNARDVDRHRSLFGPDAKSFRYSNDPHTLAERPSSVPVDAAGRRSAFRKDFVGAPAQVEAVKVFSVGDLVVAQSHVFGSADAAAKTVNEVSIYRVRDGRIVAAWLLGEETLQTPARGATP